MNFHKNGFESDFKFWPLEHPTEPSEEDNPVKCPMPYSTQLNNNNRECDQSMRHDTLRKRTEFPTAMMDGGGSSIEMGEPPALAVRKRRHSLSREDNTVISPLSMTPPLYRGSASSLSSTIPFDCFNKCGS